MANFEAVTACNTPKIKPGMIDRAGEIAGKYLYGCDVQCYVDGNGYLHLYGYDWLDVRVDDDPEDQDALDDFLCEIKETLEEPLIIQCVGNEKCRFPLSGMSIKVEPGVAGYKVDYLKGEDWYGHNE